ncbi:MAG: hypothetical protein ACLGSH_05305 [Acidobacteriota bacterium]
MPMPQRVDRERPGLPDENQSFLRRRSAKCARILWWALGMVAASLFLAGTLWGWDGSGNWWNHGRYREGTNGGGVSEPMGQVSDDPTTDDVVRQPLGSTANPNTGVYGEPEADGSTVALSPDDQPDAPADPKL